MTKPPADPGSFRDPLSRVFVADDAVIRALSGEAFADYQAAAAASFFTKAVADGRIVGTERVPEVHSFPTRRSSDHRKSVV